MSHTHRADPAQALRTPTSQALPHTHFTKAQAHTTCTEPTHPQESLVQEMGNQPPGHGERWKEKKGTQKPTLSTNTFQQETEDSNLRGGERLSADQKEKKF